MNYIRVLALCGALVRAQTQCAQNVAFALTFSHIWAQKLSFFKIVGILGTLANLCKA